MEFVNEAKLMGNNSCCVLVKNSFVSELNLKFKFFNFKGVCLIISQNFKILTFFIFSNFLNIITTSALCPKSYSKCRFCQMSTQQLALSVSNKSQTRFFWK